MRVTVKLLGVLAPEDRRRLLQAVGDESKPSTRAAFP
jgi:hypothetical protein